MSRERSPGGGRRRRRNKPEGHPSEQAPAPVAPAPSPGVTAPPAKSPISDEQIFLFNEGTNYTLYESLGARPWTLDGKEGTHFAVWAPTAKRVFVTGAFNDWSGTATPLYPRGVSGIWEGFVPGVGRGDGYKYHIVSHLRGYRVNKADPFGLWHEPPPGNASIVWDLDYEWGDADWMENRAGRNSLRAPISVYEVHPGSWRRSEGEESRPLTWRELTPLLVEHVRQLGFTHVELMPVMEHPFYGSWGYQATGFFAPTSRYGTPQDFMFLVDTLHRNGIGVILDWVPSHFPMDSHGLAFFDGTHLYEHEDPRKGFHPDWKSSIFNYGRKEVVSFLVSSAFVWLDKYHADGLRVDAVASMLYLDYSRKEGEWVPNKYGGRENLEAIEFLRRFNTAVSTHFPGVLTIAEDSTAWPMVSRPVYLGGLGFALKWDMGWMHDTLKYMARDPFFRRHHHNELTFRGMYAYSESFMLPLSHDEVVHGKRSLLGKMPGDEWRRFANLRLLYGSMLGQPGKKLLFMGSEIGQRREWSHERELDWDLLDGPAHAGLVRWVSDLNRAYRDEPALHVLDCEPGGFEWVDANDDEQSVTTFLRRGGGGDAIVLVACNYTPVPRRGYRVGVPEGGVWKEILNSDAEDYWGSGLGNPGAVEAEPVECHGRPWSLRLLLPPLAAVFLRHEPPAETDSHHPAGDVAAEPGTDREVSGEAPDRERSAATREAAGGAGDRRPRRGRK